AVHRHTGQEVVVAGSPREAFARWKLDAICHPGGRQLEQRLVALSRDMDGSTAPDILGPRESGEVWRRLIGASIGTPSVGGIEHAGNVRYVDIPVSETAIIFGELSGRDRVNRQASAELDRQ